jgi:hypothetical protein
VITVPTETLSKEEHRASPAPAPAAPAKEWEDLRAAAQRQLERVRRLKINAAAWAVGTILITTLWVVNEWQANGAFERLGHEGNPGDWNPTLWALAVGVWGLIVGMMALRVYFERPATEAEVDREVDRLQPTKGTPTYPELRRVTRARLDRIRRLKFHVAAWVLGMIVLTPIWALIEWQDNGGFERFSNDSRPGEWEPWILYVALVWGFVVAIDALKAYFDRPTTEAEIDREVMRLRSGR